MNSKKKFRPSSIIVAVLQGERIGHRKAITVFHSHNKTSSNLFVKRMGAHFTDYYPSFVETAL